MATYWFEFNLNDPGDTANLLDYVVGTYQQYVNFQAPHPTTPPGPGDTVNFYGGNALDFIAHGETWGVVTGGNLDSGDLTVDVANGLNISENGLPVYGRISGPLQILWTPVAGPAMLTATTATACFVGAQGVLDANDADAVIVQGGTVNADEITNTHDAYPSNWAVTMQFGNGYIGGTGGGARGGGAAGGGKVTAVNIINTTGAGIGMFADANGDAGIVTATNVYSTGDVGMTNTINGANQSLTVDNYDTNDQTPAGLTNLLTISDGGSVTILDSMGLGRQKGDNSTVNVTGADSSFTVDVPLTIGDAGSSVGALTVADDANATIAGDLTLQDNAKIGDSGALTAAEGGISITSGGSIEVGGSAAAPADTLRIAEGASLTGHGRITGAPTGTVPVSGSTTAPTYSLNIDNEGTIEASNGTLILDGNVSGDGQFLVGANSTLEFGGTVADGVTAMFLPGGGQTIVIDDPADFKGVISSENLESGDAIDLPNVPYIDPGSADLNPDGASYQFETGEGQQNYVLQVVENDQTYDIPINQDVPFEGSFTLTDDGNGGTLVTYSAVSQTGYSVTAVADSLPLNNAGVVKLFYKNIYTNQLTYSGTGFIVGQNLILTAAHVANVTNYSRANGYILWAYAPGRVAALPELLKPVGEQVTFLSPGVPDAKYNSLTDWAYLYVPGPPFSKTQGFSLPSKDIPLKTVTVTGYPGLVQGQNKDTGSVTVHGGLLTYPNKIAASGESGGPVWIENKLNHIKDYVGVHIAEGEALSITKIPAPDRLNPPRHFFLDPPSNAARITSAVVIQTGDADSGQTVQFVLNMSENVAVTGGGPTLILNDGGVATYNAASSTGTELEFDYTVGAGDQTSNLEVTQVNSTQTVQAPGGANVDFTVLDSQPTNLSINSPLVVTSIASPQTGEVGAGQSVQLIVSLNEAVTVNTSGGAPTLWLNDNETATYDATASNPLAGTLVFDYTVGSGDETANLEITSVNLPTGTTIQDAAGYNANFSAADNAPTGLQVGPAYITAITPSQSGDLTAGQTVQLTLAMSEGVTVDTSGGSPTLSLSDGAAATYDAAASNPSSGILVFDYAVGASDYTTDLQVLGYNPNGATVADAYGVNADLSGATQYDLALDVNAAVVASLAVSPTTGEADSGQLITLTLTMSAPVSVDLTGGSPTLSLDDGGAATYDSAASDPSTGTLVFDYTVGAGDETPSLAISQVNLNGAAIDDANGHAADLSAAASFTTTLQVGPAFVSSVTPSLTGEIFTAQTDQITLAMSQAVTVDTTNGAPTLSLSDGAVATYDAGASDPSSGALAFDYVVGANDYKTDLTVLGYNSNGAAVTDASGVNADFSGVAKYDLGLDVNAAIVTGVTASPSSGEADSGAGVAVTLTMSEAVTVNTTNGAPSLDLGNGATATYDSTASNPSNGTLVFDYTVGATDETPDLQVIQVKLNGAAIVDANGNAADLSAAANFDTGLQIGPVYVNQVTPSLSGDITTGQTVQLSVSMSAGLTVDATNGSPALRLSDGAYANYDAAASSPASGTLVFDYTVATGDYATGLSVVGFNANGASVVDANGVGPDFSGLAQSALGLDVNAATVVRVPASPSTGAAVSGQQVLLTLTMSEPINVNTAGGSPTLYLSDGAIAAYDSAASNPSAGTLAFDFTVGPGDDTPNLAITKVNLRGALITDGQGNAPDFGAALGAGTGLDISAACYRRGARLATPSGYAAIEDLREGDLVLTAAGATRPVRWIGHRVVDCAGHPDPARVWPVRVSRGAFGDGLPRRDLWLSPGHNVASEGVLMPISALVNGRSVAQIEMESVEYWHVELDAHDLLLAEGLPAESYLDCGNRTAFANGGAFIEAHPDFQPKHWAETCLPLVKEGPQVARAKARLIEVLQAQGYWLTAEAEAHIVADGEEFEPVRLSETRLAFILPAGGEKIVLRSKKFTPAHTRATSTDTRELGLCVKRLQIDGEDFALDRDEALGPGWHDAECENGAFARRWTSGKARLPAGARIVMVDLGGQGLYWRAPNDNVVALFG